MEKFLTTGAPAVVHDASGNDTNPAASERDLNGDLKDALASLRESKFVDIARNELNMSLPSIKEFCAKVTSVVNDHIAEESRKCASSVNSSSGEVYLKLENVSVLEPRGRFDLQLGQGGLFLDGKAGSCFVSWSAISHISIVPSSATTKKEGEDIIALQVTTGAEQPSFNGKFLSNILWTLSKGGKQLLVACSGKQIKGVESDVVTNLLGAIWSSNSRRVILPRKDIFQSFNGKAYLRCYMGIKEGVLYPLSSGILFLKPMLFIPAESVASITAGRGGSAQTRYIDLKVETAENKSFEFSNIDRDELPSLQGFVAFYLKERRKAEKIKPELSSATGATIEKMKGGEGEEDSDDSDEDFDPDESEEEDDDSSSQGSEEDFSADGEDAVGPSSDGSDESSDDSDDLDDDDDDECDGIDSGDEEVMHELGGKRPIEALLSSSGPAAAAGSRKRRVNSSPEDGSKPVTSSISISAKISVEDESQKSPFGELADSL